MTADTSAANRRTQAVLELIAAERKRQRAKGYDREHDQSHTLIDLITAVKNYLGWAHQMDMMNSRGKARQGEDQRVANDGPPGGRQFNQRRYHNRRTEELIL